MTGVIDIKKALRVFHKITSQGERVGSDYSLGGLRASQGFDGYTASIFNDYVRLDLLFHNKFNFNADNAKERQVFLDALDKLDRNL